MTKEGTPTRPPLPEVLHEAAPASDPMLSLIHI